MCVRDVQHPTFPRCGLGAQVTLADAAKGERGVRAGAFSETLEEGARVFYVVPTQR